MTALAARTHVALLHHPVRERSGRVVTTAITNLDIHDIARATRTYGLARYYLVTPIEAQRQLASRILGHWVHGEGREFNDKRSEALETVRVVPGLEDARADVAAVSGRPPWVVATGARPRAGVTGYRELVEARQADPAPILLVFGTGWGLADEVFRSVDAVLAPIQGAGEYNHLSVRSAVAIVLDRLFGNRDLPGPQ